MTALDALTATPARSAETLLDAIYAQRPIVPALTAAEVIDAYSLDTYRRGQQGIERKGLANWLQWCNTPRPPRVFRIVGSD